MVSASRLFSASTDATDGYSLRGTQKSRCSNSQELGSRCVSFCDARDEARDARCNATLEPACSELGQETNDAPASVKADTANGSAAAGLQHRQSVRKCMRLAQVKTGEAFPKHGAGSLIESASRAGSMPAFGACGRQPSDACRDAAAMSISGPRTTGVMREGLLPLVGETVAKLGVAREYPPSRDGRERPAQLQSRGAAPRRVHTAKAGGSNPPSATDGTASFPPRVAGSVTSFLEAA